MKSVWITMYELIQKDLEECLKIIFNHYSLHGGFLPHLLPQFDVHHPSHFFDDNWIPYVNIRGFIVNSEGLSKMYRNDVVAVCCKVNQNKESAEWHRS